MVKCEKCKKNKATCWIYTKYVCEKCFNKEKLGEIPTPSWLIKLRENDNNKN